MKHIQILGTLAVAAASLTAFVGTAAATKVTTTTGGAAATPTIHLIDEAWHVTISNQIGTISCSSTLEGSIESDGVGFTAKGGISTLLFTNCTNVWHVTAIVNGSLEIHYTSGHDGTIGLVGFKVDTTRFGVTCVYEAPNGISGIVTGGHPAMMRFISLIPLAPFESSVLCGEGASKFEASYFTTGGLYVGS